MSAKLTEREAAWVLALAEARVKKQQRRLDNYELRKGDDTDHYDILAVNLTWMEDATKRLAAVLAEAKAYGHSVSDREALAIADQHDIQTRLK